LEGRWAVSIELCDRAADILREQCTNVAWELNSSHFFLLWSLAYAGRITELGRRRPILLKEAHERGDRHAVATLGSIALSQLAADDPEGALRETRLASSEWNYPGFHIQHFYSMLYSAEALLYSGDVEKAWDHLSEQWPAYSDSLLNRIQRTYIDIVYIR